MNFFPVRLSLLITLFFCSIHLHAQETELLTNPDFNDGTNGWWAYGADISTNNGEVAFDISEPGSNIWDIQLGQGSITLRQGFKYTLCWRAKRDNGTLVFNVGLGEAPYTLYFNDIPENFDGTWQENCVEYIHTGEDINNVAVTLNMGGSDANATIDYISLLEDPNNEVTLTFRVDMQFETVSPDGVFIAGSFNNWETPVEMEANGSEYSTSLELKKGETIVYKFINGDSPEDFTGDCTAGEDNNRTLVVPEYDDILDLVCFNSCNYCIDPIVFNTNPGAGPVSFYGEMQVNGNRIYGERTNTPVLVKGISLFWSIWGGEKFWNCGAVNTLVDEWDIELIRAPMSVENNNGWDFGYLHENGKTKQIAFMETVVEAAIARDIYVIVDYHSHYADQNVETAIEFFSYMAEKYGHYDHVIFEIYNEPILPDWPAIKTYAEAVIEAIREYSDNLVVVGTESYSTGVDNASLSPIDDPNTAYVFHFYANHQEELREKVRTALNNGSALFATEWGNIFVAGENEGLTTVEGFENSDTWHALMDEYYISSANWCVYIDDFENASGLFYDENGFNGNVSYTGENWTNQSIISPSGMYVYNMLKQQAADTPWRLAEQEVYTIDYHLGGGKNGANPALYPYNLEEDIMLDEATKEGYLFEGWYNNAEFTGDPMTEIPAGSSGNINLHAKWTEATVIELLDNSDFSLGTYNWVHWSENDSVAVEDGQIIIRELTDNSGQLWTYGFHNTNYFTLKEGYRYTLHWRAKRESGEIKFEAAQYEPALNVFFSDTPEMNGDWQENTITYDHTTETVYGVGFSVFVGGYTPDVSFDYISLTESEIVEAPILKISEIQGNNEVSPYIDQLVQTGGEITFITEYGCYIQDEEQLRSGIFIFSDAFTSLQIGDGLNVKGYVTEYNGLTEIADVIWTETYSSTLGISPIIVDGTEIDKDNESVLITIENVTAIEENENSDWIVEYENLEQVVIDDKFYLHELISGNQYNISGIVVYRYELYGLNPRFESDIESIELPKYETSVTFRVDMQNETVSSNVYLCGSFNDWDSDEPLEKEGTVYSKTLELTSGETVEYKFANGDEWELNIPDECGSGDNNNRFLTVPDDDTVLEVVCFNSCEGCPQSVFEINGRVISVYPNPANDILTIKGIDAFEKINIQLIAANGQVVKEFDFEGKNTNPDKINISELKKGLYTLLLTTTNGDFSQKIIKN
ncbi:MAG: cellulase family glycosylhydrolase [Prolixibacteraceae bacterium]|nr:cellulase family glycosylhydrolase [Prolixibacteraceae bacterium]